MISKAWFKNVLDVVPGEKGYHPVRFTAEQLQLYGENEAFRVRSQCSSGGMLDLLTDSTFVRITYYVEEGCRDWLYFDLYVNNRFVGSIGSDELKTGEGSVLFELQGIHKPGSLRRVSIYLPHVAVLHITGIEFSNESVVEEAPSHAKQLLCLGDSITQGMDAKRPSSAYPVLLSRYLGMNLLNHGVGGYFFNKDSLDRRLPYQPDWITVAYGTNDWHRWNTLSELESKAEGYLSTLKELYPDAMLFVMTPIWRADWNEPKAMGSFAEVMGTIEKVSRSIGGIQLIDGLDIVPHQPSYYGDRTVHPSDEGFLHMALNMLKRMRADGNRG
ncbi:SGNH/GDSL hydrolase family protein [Paenibacillus sp. J2TS4]|uniref:SGNH/GDSL hydrolase family protein n=1 Tax=Paenibacillus sp. J2TS4 TaxID=2807194 RepID=UPI001B25E4AC|nr:SGNH/GDSL hydrolase family protein [Paenibacillus sp. J2TS4]GIP35291.1 hypothetical protein J2TS4_45010 [Paenibacillus sp. J2TS4]